MAHQTQNFEPLLKTKFDYTGTWSTRHGWECDLKLMTVKMGSRSEERRVGKEC